MTTDAITNVQLTFSFSKDYIIMGARQGTPSSWNPHSLLSFQILSQLGTYKTIQWCFNKKHKVCITNGDNAVLKESDPKLPYSYSTIYISTDHYILNNC
jgi:hypothetical protein